MFREHLFHMVFPEEATEIIDTFITKSELKFAAASN
jgi:hypothetical protein